MSDDDRGWNIVGGKARSTPVAKLLGASRSGERSYVDIGILLVLLFITGSVLGLW